MKLVPRRRKIRILKMKLVPRQRKIRILKMRLAPSRHLNAYGSGRSILNASAKVLAFNRPWDSM